MHKKKKISLGIVIMAIAGLSMMGFQNCAKAKFTPSNDNLVLRTESMPTDDTIVDPQGGDEGLPPEATPTPSPSPTPVSSPTPSGTPPLSTTLDENDLVECQMLSPSSKVILASEFEMQHSNSSATRVCMSRKACLEIINEYAASHSCTLLAGPGSDPADPNLQCTEIFPGTKGTCHKARKLSDQQVADQLEALLNAK